MTAPELTDWIGRQETQTGVLTEQMAAMAHATLMETPHAPVAGDRMPQLWHWFAFPGVATMDQIGRDGHPKRGGFLPPVPLERRMWAAGQLRFHAPLYVGEPLTRVSQIDAVAEKHGAAGPMVFVTVVHEVSGENGLAITERQDIVYLNIADPFVPPPKKLAPTDGLTYSHPVAISEALLFRYSAITFNAHRIHYDLDYTRSVERYPALVVHGPLQANLLMAAATHVKGTAPSTFAFRGIHPMFHTSDLTLRAWRGEENETDLKLCTAADAGHQGMTATATWEEV